MLAMPWQQHRNRASMWPLGVLAGALVALPPLLGVLVSPVVARDAAVVCWIIVVIAIWVTTALSLMLQNEPVAARLVPGHVSRLRILLSLSWVVATLAISLAFGLAYGLAAHAIIFVGTGVLLLLFALRWPVLWLPWWLLSWALPSSVPWWERNAPARALLLSAVQHVAAQPLPARSRRWWSGCSSCRGWCNAAAATMCVPTSVVHDGRGRWAPRRSTSSSRRKCRAVFGA
jgi:hypothetical protein